MVSYCGASTLSPIKGSGISACFLETLLPFLGLTLLLLSSLRLFKAKNLVKPMLSRKWYYGQIGLTFIGVLNALVHISSHVFIPEVGTSNSGLALYIVLCDVSYTLSWLLCGVLLRSDYYNNREAGVFTLFFWLNMAITRVIELCSYTNNDWFNFTSTIGWIDFGVCIVGITLATVFPIMDKFMERRRTAKKREYMALGEHGHFDLEQPKSGLHKNYERVRLLLPFVWPASSFVLQMRVVAALLLLIAGRVVNLYVPMYYKRIVDSLTQQSGYPMEVPLGLIGMYSFLRLLQGNGGLNNIRQLVWIKVTQYTSKKMKVKVFEHLHSLSLHWHLNRQTGSTLRIMDRGTSSVTDLLSSIVFSMTPTIVDIVIAIVFFVVAFDAVFGVIVMGTMVSYLVFTIVVTEWRTKFRKSMNEKDNKSEAISVDSLLNFETVKYFGAEKFEVDRYEQSINDYQAEEWISVASLNFLNAGQGIIITLGLFFGSLLSAYRIQQGEQSSGDFVMFIAYLLQLYTPLNWFGTYWRVIQRNFVDMENMFELLEYSPGIVDSPSAIALRADSAPEISFNNVDFSYGERKILDNVSFTIPKGQTFALVGTSGGGKSTIIRLLFRFYDVTDGSITIDGQDIRDVTQTSLRHAIGVVPQDTVLFNDSIEYNIKYGRVTAKTEEVREASKAAEMDERINLFEKGYDTMVGERGLRLSGGEKQRVAIARTILKNPAVVLLDEATSALDTETERAIQTSLNKICKNRTSVVVAHRLSTITKADQILVMKEGQISERGTHSELLVRKGTYFDMWNRQLESDHDEEVAHRKEKAQ
eukprot:CFRG5743T1